MKKIIITCIFVTLFIFPALAEERHTFYDGYDPSSASYVYDSSNSATTGDVVDVFTYDKKTIFISAETINSRNIEYRIEGRPVGERDTWSILDVGDIGKGSSDVAKNVAVDVSELVDYLRVGLRVAASDGIDSINVRGIFRKSN